MAFYDAHHDVGGGHPVTPRGSRPLLLRGLLWRRWTSLTTLLVASLAIGFAALGPLFAQAAGESTLTDELSQADVTDSGFELVVPAAQGNAFGLTTRLDGGPKAGEIVGYPRRILGADALITVSAPSGALRAPLVWREDWCAHVRFVAGSCPTGSRDVAVSRRTSTAYRIGLGTTLDLGGVVVLGPTGPAGVRGRVVGLYEPLDVAGGYWFGHRSYFAPAPGDDSRPDRIDAMLITRELADVLAGGPDVQDVRALADYPLDAGGVRLADVARLRASVAGLPARFGTESQLVVSTSLSDVLDRAATGQRLVSRATLVVTAQLALLSWIVLYGLVADSFAARAGEIALAKLRGRSVLATLRYAVSEPLALLVLAVPLGLLLGLAATHLFARTIFAPGTPVGVPTTTFAAVLAAFAGAAVAALVAARKVLAVPVLELGRAATVVTDPPRRPWVGLLAAALLVGVLTVALRAPGAAPALALPGLVVLLVALPVVLALPAFAARLATATRASPRLATFLASRQVARRPTGLRLALVLSVALGLSVFAVASENVAAAGRDARASTELGAPRVVLVDPTGTVDPERVVAQVDPDHAWSMAVARWIPDGGGAAGYLLGVSPAALPSVALSAPGAPSPEEVARVLGFRSVPPVVLTGTRARLVLSVLQQPKGPPPRPVLLLANDTDRVVRVQLTPLRPGRAAYEAAVPCARGCRLTGVVIDRSIDAVGPQSGSVRFESVEVARGAGWDEVSARWNEQGAWRAMAPQGAASDTVYARPDGLVDTFRNDGGGYGGVSSAAQPDVVPVVATPGTFDAARAPQVFDSFDHSLTLHPEVITTGVPGIADVGALVDLDVLRDTLPGMVGSARWEVWLGPAAPADATTRLAKAGLPVTAERTVTGRVAELGRQGPALALRLLLALAIAGAVLAAGGTALAVGASSRRRSYEMAALRTLGVPRRTVLAAAVLEHALVLAPAVLVGVPVGALLARLVMPSVPQFSDTWTGPTVSVPSFGPVALYAVGFVAVLALTAYLGGLGVARQAEPARLREGDE